MRLFILVITLFMFLLPKHAGATAFFEVGSVDVSDTIHNAGTWVSVPLTKNFVNPIVVAGPITENNDRTLIVRVRNVTATSFEIGMMNGCEDKGSGFCVPASGSWVTETIPYLVFEEGTWEFPDDQLEVEAYTHNTNTCREGIGGTGGCGGSNSSDTISYTHTYTASPVVLTTITTANSTNFANSLARSSTALTNPPGIANFGLTMDLQETALSYPASEDIAWIALQRNNNGTNMGKGYSSGRSADNVRGHGTCQSVGYTVADFPNTVAKLQALDGGNGGEVRFCDEATPTNASRIRVHIDEDQVANAERNHTTEQVGWFAFKEDDFGLLDFLTGTISVVDAGADGSASPGEILTYTVTITNELNDFTQSNNAGNELEVPLPAGVTFNSVVSASSGTLAHSAGTVTWNGGLTANQTVTLVFDVTADSDVCDYTSLSTGGTIFMDANNDGTNAITEPLDDTSYDDGSDIDDDTLTDDDDPTVINTSCDADIEINKTADDNTPDEGGTVVYTISITNHGPADPATNIQVLDNLPAGVTIQSTSPSTGTVTP